MNQKVKRLLEAIAVVLKDEDEILIKSIQSNIEDQIKIVFNNIDISCEYRCASSSRFFRCGPSPIIKPTSGF